MTGLTRRAVLGGGAAAALAWRAPAFAAAESVRAALDDAAVEPDPARALALLDGLSAAGLPEGLRLDLVTAREGLAADAALKQRPDSFALRLRRNLGAIAPEEAERRLRVELDRCLAQATRLFNRIGVRGGTVGARYARLWRNERYLYPDSSEGRERAVADMNRTLAMLRGRTPALVGPVPPWCLDVAARRMSPADEAAGKGGYRELPMPGSPGGYFVDLKEVRRRPRWTLPSVVAHELLPGHMVQMPMEAAAGPHPLRLRYAPAFPEGWGVHAETLIAWDDPLAELGRLHWLLFRIGRGLADIGIHLRGWSQEQARAQLVAWQGEPAYFAPFETDLARIAKEPATRTAEALAWLGIADAARGLGARERIRFHQALLVNGRMREDEVNRLGKIR